MQLDHKKTHFHKDDRKRYYREKQYLHDADEDKTLRDSLKSNIRENDLS